MADGKLPLSPASAGGQVEDVEALNVPNPTPPPPGPGLIQLVRQRIQIVGRLYSQIAAVLDTDPAAGDFGLVTRGVDAAKETTLAAISALQLPAALVGGRLNANVGAWLGSTVPTVGQKTMAQSVPVVLPSDQTVSIGLGVADKSPFTYGVSVEQPVGGVYQDAAPTLAAGTSGAARLTEYRAFHSNLRNGGGVEVGTAGSPLHVAPQVVGAHGNAWSAAVVLAGGVSASIDAQYTPHISVFGNVSAATTITIQFSQDNVNFYDAVSAVVNGNFSISGSFGARYLRLKSSAARTITATIAGKD